MNHFTTKEQTDCLISNGFAPRTVGNWVSDKWYLSDLLEMLPIGVSISKGGENLVGIESDDWFVDYAYEDENGDWKYKVFHSEDLIQAVIDMLVELKTNK